jgi:hypothetical protein
MRLADWHHVGGIEKIAYFDLVINGPLHMGSHVTSEHCLFFIGQSHDAVHQWLGSLDNAQITHRAIAKGGQRFLIGGAGIGGTGLLKAVKLNHNGAVVLAGFLNGIRHAARQKPAARCLNGWKRQRRIGCEFFIV